MTSLAEVQAHVPILFDTLQENQAAVRAEEESSKNFQNFTRLPYDPCAHQCHLKTSTAPGMYGLYERIPEKQKQIEEQQIRMMKETISAGRNGYGWSGKEGALVDNDSVLRNTKSQLTNPRVIHQVCENPYITGPFLGSANGLRDYAQEAYLKQGLQTDVRATPSRRGFYCPRTAELNPLEHKVKAAVDPQFWDKESWQRFGTSTRTYVKNVDYKKVCQANARKMFG